MACSALSIEIGTAESGVRISETVSNTWLILAPDAEARVHMENILEILVKELRIMVR